MVYDAGGAGGEVTAIRIEDWESGDFPRTEGAPEGLDANWTATLRLKQPLGFILSQVDGTKIVQVVAKEGEEIPFEGTVTAVKFQGEWDVSAFEKGEPWDGIWKRAGTVTMGYQVFDGLSSSFTGRGTTFQPLSRLKPCVEEGSEEFKKLMAEFQERQQRAREVAAEAQRKRQEAAEEQQRKQREAYAEAQRKAQEEAAEKARLAQEETQRRAEEARRARLLPFLAPFQSKAGAVITTDAGDSMGWVILEAQADDSKFTVSGKGIDLREMPFREFTFQGGIDDRLRMTVTTSLSPDPLLFTAVSGQRLVGARGLALSPLAEADRARLDSLIVKGKRLQSASPADLTVETLDAKAAKAREADLQAASIPGIAIYRSQKNVQIASMFTVESNGRYRWIKEPVAHRLNESTPAKAIYIKGGAGPSDNLTVIINGVHRATIPAIERYGAAIVKFPADIEILDIRLEAGGTAQARGVVLLK